MFTEHQQTEKDELVSMLSNFIKSYDDKPSLSYVRLTRDEAARLQAALEWKVRERADVVPSNALRADHGLAAGQCIHGVRMSSHCDSCATPPQPVAAEVITEELIADAVRNWFPDRINQADYFAAAVFGHPKNAHQEHLAAMAGTGSDESKKGEA